MSPTVVTGDGDAAGFIESVEGELARVLGFRPYSGTLNVDSLPVLEELTAERVSTDPLVNEHCDGVVVSPCSIGGVRSAVLRPLVTGYPEDKVELVAPVRLRSLFGLDAGDAVDVSPPESVWHPEGGTVRPGSLEGFDAVVFDLDGTLVDLDVAWEEVHAGIERILDGVLDGPLSEYNRPEVMRIAREHGLYDELDELLTEHEDDGAETATALSLLEWLAGIDRPVGVCTANASSAARRALERHGVRDRIDALVARDTVEEGKPHPRPLRRCLADLGADAGNAVFVGDERTDAETAVAAGTSFLHPDQFE